MNDLCTEIQGAIYWLTINRGAKHNAFDDHLLLDMQRCLDEAIANPQIKIIILKANGKHFSAGADLDWMQRMAGYTEEENIKDALVLAKVMRTLHQSAKPTIAMIHGSAFGGGAGLAAACDIAIAATNARFCFSEVKLGLIPAVISPYVVKAIGARAANALFISAELFDAARAKELHLIHHCVPESELQEFTLNYAQQICRNAPEAVQQAKCLVESVANKAIDDELVRYTAQLIAQKRVSPEGREGIHAFLNKETPNWN